MKKRIYSIFISAAIALSMVVSMPSVAMADEVAETVDTGVDVTQYTTYIQTESLLDGTTSVIYTGKKEKIKTAGFSYDAKKNILTITNLNMPNQKLIIDDMGSDFKLKLHGTNHIGAIVVNGSDEKGIAKKGAALYLAGAGKLVVNEKKYSVTPIQVLSSSVACKFTCGEYASLTVYGQGETENLIDVRGISAAKSIVFSNKKVKAQVNTFDDSENNVHTESIVGSNFLVKGKAHTHKWIVEKVVKKASFDNAGKVKYICDSCGTTKTAALPKIDRVVLEVYGFQYSGKPCKPGIIVKDMKGNVISSEYFSVVYKNNVNPGWGKAIVTLKGLYSGKIEKQFVIGKKPY